jgi:hypothetical protein
MNELADSPIFPSANSPFVVKRPIAKRKVRPDDPVQVCTHIGVDDARRQRLSGCQKREERSQQYRQNPQTTKSIRGGINYRRLCGECHGLDATGYRGPIWSSIWAGATRSLFRHSQGRAWR